MHSVEVTICDKSATLKPTDLGEFLFLFPATGRALSQIVPAHEHDALRAPTPKELAKYRHELGRLSPEELDSFFYPKTSDDMIQINQISRTSSLEMTLCGCAFLISLGVIFSGGKVAISRQSLKAELPPFGKGLAALREALGLNDRVKAGFGIREIVIKLDEREYAALCMQDDASQNQGGFQHFLVGLKNRINKQTREIHLGPSDLERIYHYKANPQKGGWQSRFKKIFGRHFPEQGETLL
jgi:hypothetical protein